MAVYESSKMCLPTDTTPRGVEVYIREERPAHYSLKVEGFSLLLRTKFEKYESGIFEAGGYNWSLRLYPNGDKKFDGEGYVSLYLVLEGTDALNRGWEVNVNFKLFVYDQKRDVYLTIQDADGAMRRFHELKKECGFPQLISLDDLKEASNGYLVDDCCIFGAEVFVVKPLSRCETLAMTMPTQHSHKTTLKLDRFSKMKIGCCYHKPFQLGGRNWILCCCPKGESRGDGKLLWLRLMLDDARHLPPKGKLYAECKLRVLDQLNKSYREFKFNRWFTGSKLWGEGLYLMPLEELRQKGLIYKDAVTVEIEIRPCELKVRDGNDTEKEPSLPISTPHNFRQRWICCGYGF